MTSPLSHTRPAQNSKLNYRDALVNSQIPKQHYSDVLAMTPGSAMQTRAVSVLLGGLPLRCGVGTVREADLH
jgi:hypothetical protein